jgi:hypothetical protein
MLLPKKLNLVVPQGGTFSTTQTILDGNNNPVSLTNFLANSGNSAIRKHYDSCNPTTYFEVIVANNTVGQVTLQLSANVTANIYYGRYVYDVNLTDNSGNVTKVLEGQVYLTPGVTRSANSPV